MIPYFYTITDNNGYIHSIDNCIIHYTLNTLSINEFIDYVHELKKTHYLNNEYWENINNKPCSHYQFYNSNIHFCNGLYMNIGKYNLTDKDNPVIVPIISLEVNLNKHYQKDYVSDLLEYLKNNSIYIELIKYDYAIDVPVSPENIEVFGSRKEKGLYKGTRNYGQRNKHGRCKIYDKKIESGLDEDMTRIEHTIETSRVKKTGYSLETFYVQGKEIKENDNLDKTDKIIIKMLSALKSYGEDVDKYIMEMSHVKKEKIKSAFCNREYIKYEYDENIIKELVEYVENYIGCKYEKKIREDENGFLINDDFDIPFD